MRLSLAFIALVQLAVLQSASVDAFSSSVGSRVSLSSTALRKPLLRKTPFAATSVAASDGDVASVSKAVKELSTAEKKKQERLQLIKQQGGFLTFNTKFGALNPFAIYYGVTSILLGIPWFIVLTICQFFYLITGNRFDRNRRIPVFFTQIWGTVLMSLTGNWPKMENMEILRAFYKEKRPAMFVANHASWMDIPFFGGLIGWRNYKFVSKNELGGIPILGKAIKVGGNLMLDRSNRRSQLKTLKDGIKTLKNGVHLCTFPEGTRSRSGKLGKFKNGAFKMAHKAKAPVIPVSIVGAVDVMPAYWMFPYRPARSVCKMIVHEPVESEGKTEAELAAAVRKAMVSGLPEENRPDDE